MEANFIFEFNIYEKKDPATVDSRDKYALVPCNIKGEIRGLTPELVGELLDAIVNIYGE